MYHSNGSFTIGNLQQIKDGKRLRQIAEKLSLWGREQKLKKWPNIRKGLWEIFAFCRQPQNTAQFGTDNKWHRRVSGRWRSF